MRLALNYQRVDPSRGGAETYVVDLCHRLVGSGTRSTSTPSRGARESCRRGAVRRRRRAGPNPKLGRMLALRAGTPRRRSTAADHDCTVGFINTWHHDVIIPQGGVHGGSLEANARRFPAGWRRVLYLLGKKANPKYWATRRSSGSSTSTTGRCGSSPSARW